jgi:16S rRNA (cytidine1402-2'-O)-methyltransferase
MAGMLYLCATPIGNLEDITLRVLRILEEADLIAAEDTRNTLKLLNHFGIKTPMTSYHEHNKIEKADTLIEKIKAGADVALVTDAGTPAISDPGEVLVRKCYEAGVPVTSLPGPAACITALTLSGLPARRFVFEGFLPPEKKERRRVLEALAAEGRTCILYEAPHHLRKTLDELREALGGERRIALCRELTKRFEQVQSMTLSEAVAWYECREPKGEYVLVLQGKSREETEQEARQKWQSCSIEEHVRLYMEQGNDKKEAMKLAAKDRGMGKREIYQALLNSQQ